MTRRLASAANPNTNRTSACCGIHWYEVPGDRYACPAYTRGCAGWWQPPHTIYMAQTRLDDRVLVEHEMLHDLLQRSDHPPVFKACGV